MLERQIRCFLYGERSDVPRLQQLQVEQKAVGWQSNLGLRLRGAYIYICSNRYHLSVCLSRIGFRMITCERKVGLDVCMCILWISRSSLIMVIFRKYYQSCAPFCSSNLLNFWFPDDNLWAKSQMCGMSFRHFLLKLLQNNFNIWTYKITLVLEDLWPTAFYYM